MAIRYSYTSFLRVACFLLFCPGLAFTTATAQSSRGDLFISSRNTNGIKQFDGQTGEFIGDFVPSRSGDLVRPQEVVFGPDGHLYVTGFENTTIKRYDGETGEYLGDFSSGYDLQAPTKMAFHTDGMIYVSQWEGTQKVVRFDIETGAFVDEFTSTAVVNGMDQAWDEEGNLYVASWGTNGSNGSVHKFDASGTFDSFFVARGSGGLQGPVNLWFSKGDLFVVDWTQGDVLRYDGTTGEYKDAFITGMVRTEGFAIDEEGTIYMADWQLNRINTYDSTGAFIETFIAGNVNNPNSLVFKPAQSSTSTDEVPDASYAITLHPTYPNPFSDITHFTYTLPPTSILTIDVFDVTGSRVRQLLHAPHHGGEQTLSWDGRGDQGQFLPSGLYMYRLRSDTCVKTRTVLLIR